MASKKKQSSETVVEVYVPAHWSELTPKEAELLVFVHGHPGCSAEDIYWALWEDLITYIEPDKEAEFGEPIPVYDAAQNVFHVTKGKVNGKFKFDLFEVTGKKVGRKFEYTYSLRKGVKVRLGGEQFTT